MIISNSQVQGLIAKYTKDNLKVNNRGKDELTFPKIQKSKSDQVQVSQDTQAYMVAREAVKKVPDIREERLSEIEERIKTGTYEVTSEEIAEKIIGRSLVDKLV